MKGDAESYKILSVLGKGNFGVVSKVEKSGVRLRNTNVRRKLSH